MKISTYFLLFFALFLCNFAKAQDTIPTSPTPSPELQKVMNRVPEIKKAIDSFVKDRLVDKGKFLYSIDTLHKVIDNAFDKNKINDSERMEIFSYTLQILLYGKDIVVKEKENLKKEVEKNKKKIEENKKKIEEKQDLSGLE
jgi:hypothetical protein